MFDGGTYDPLLDLARLGKQLRDVYLVMRDGQWRTLYEIQAATGHHSTAAVSARLRDFRKEQFGSHVVERRRRGATIRGVFEYRLLLNGLEPEGIDE